MLGEYYLDFMRKRGYDEMLRNLGSNILEFLQNLDSVHALCKRDYPDMVAPSFRCDEDSASDRMVLHYYSVRKGLYPIVKGNANQIYSQQITSQYSTPKAVPHFYKGTIYISRSL